MSPLESDQGRAFDRAAQDSEDRAMALALYLAHSAQPGLDPEATTLLEMFRLARERRESEWQRYIATWSYPAMLTGRPVAAEAVCDSDDSESEEKAA